MTATSRLLSSPGPLPQAGLLAASLAALLLVSPTSAQEPRQPADDGVFITVTNPITSEVKNRVYNIAEEARAGKNGRVISKIIFDFNPSDRGAASSPDFGPCYDLAKYIRSLQNLTTVAFVHHEVSRH